MEIKIAWEGPLAVPAIIKEFDRAGSAPDWDGEDYGVYQIYGRHILGDRNALLYVGEATMQTFAARFRQHMAWLQHEWSGIKVYLGRCYHRKRHSARDAWASWRSDMLLAERIMIYKYSPHYNSAAIAERPLLLKLNGDRTCCGSTRSGLPACPTAPC